MDTLALEPVENGLSILFGYVAYCVTIVTLGIVAMPFRRLVPKNYVIGIVLGVSFVIFVLVMFTSHDVLNTYQHWYTTPFNQGL